MTVLHNLNAYLTERFMTAAREILEVVGNTILEYQEETARTMRENEELRQRLREIGVHNNVMSDRGHPVAPSVSIGATPQGQQPHKQESNSSLREGREPPLTDNKQEFPEQRVSKPEQGLMDTWMQASSLTCADSPSDHKLLQPSPTFEEKTEVVGSVPHMLLERIKSEPVEMDHCTEEHPIFPQPLNRVSNASNTAESENIVDMNWMESGGVMPETNEQDSGREVSIVSCPWCTRTFSQLSDLKIHLRIHKGEKPARLKPHEGIHPGKARNCFSVCGKSSPYLGKLKEHVRIHTGAKPFGCTVCGKGFSQSIHLKVHLRVHTGEKPYGCPFCGKRFIQSSQIKRHLAIHTR